MLGNTLFIKRIFVSNINMTFAFLPYSQNLKMSIFFRNADLGRRSEILRKVCLKTVIPDLLFQLKMKKNNKPFQQMFHFYTPWKRQKTRDFWSFSGGIETERWPKWVKKRVKNKYLFAATCSKSNIKTFEWLSWSLF